MSQPIRSHHADSRADTLHHREIEKKRGFFFFFAPWGVSVLGRSMAIGPLGAAVCLPSASGVPFNSPPPCLVGPHYGPLGPLSARPFRVLMSLPLGFCAACGSSVRLLGLVRSSSGPAPSPRGRVASRFRLPSWVPALSLPSTR